MARPRIRVSAMCLFLNGDRFLVFEEMDRSKGSAFARPLGGGLDFGESAEEALAREMREELGAEIEDPLLLAVIENRFVQEDVPGHEIVFMFDARLRDPALYGLPELPWRERPTEPFRTAYWRTLADFASGEPRLVPEELPGIIERELARRREAAG